PRGPPRPPRRCECARRGGSRDPGSPRAARWALPAASRGRAGRAPPAGPTAVRAAPPRRRARAPRWRARSPPPGRGSGAVLPAPGRDRPRETPARRAAARTPTADPASSGSSVHQIEQLQLHLARPAAEARELDVAHAAEEGLGLHERHDPPAQVAEHLPPAHHGRIDRRAAGALVGGEEALALAQPPDRRRGTEAPRPHAE